jgi:MFS transporter, FSR family, fosmidomycin resistance protein
VNKKLQELFILHFLNDGVRTSFIILLPFIAKDLHITYAQVGFLGSSQPLISSLLAIPTGYVAARFGGFRLLITLLLIYALSAVGIALSTSVVMIIVTFLISAFGFGMFHTIGFALVGKASEKTNIGRNMGDFTSVGELGRIIIPPAAVFVASLSNWRLTMLGVGGIGILLYVFFRFIRPVTEPHIAGIGEIQETKKEFILALTVLLKKKQLLLVALSGIIDAFASSPIYVFLPFLLISKGFTAPQMGIITAAFFAGGFIGKSALGRIVDKKDNKKVLLISELSMAVVLVLLTLITNFAIMLVIGFILGIFTKGTYPVIQTLYSQVVQQFHYNKIYAVGELCSGLGAMASLLFMGIVADRYSIQPVFYISAFSAVATLIPILLLQRVQKN